MTKQTQRQPDMLITLSAAEVFERYADMVYRLAFSRTKNRSDADDLLQEVFLRYIKSGAEFSEEEHRKAWLIRVTLNCSISFMSSAWMRRTVPLSNQHKQVTSNRTSGSSDILEAVMQLPAKYRTAIHLFYYEGYSITEIAQLCEIPEATVKTHLHRAREKLKKKLKGENEDE